MMSKLALIFQLLIITKIHDLMQFQWTVKVAEHSFQVPMPNSPLLLNYL